MFQNSSSLTRMNPNHTYSMENQGSGYKQRFSESNQLRIQQQQHKSRERQSSQSPSQMTSFQSYLIAKNSSPLSKLHQRDQNPKHYLSTQEVEKPRYNSRNGPTMFNFDHSQSNENEINVKPYQNKSKEYLMEMSHTDHNQSQQKQQNYQLQSSQSTFINPIQPINPILQNKNLPDDYLKIINEIEEKRSRSKARFQPTQAPQNHSQVLNSSARNLSQGIRNSNLQQQYDSENNLKSEQSQNNITTITQGYNQKIQDPNVKFLDQLYHNQALNQRQSPQKNYGLQSQRGQLQIDVNGYVPPVNLSGPSLLQYYQQKFNLLQQAQQQIQAQQQSLFSELQIYTQKQDDQSQYAPSSQGHPIIPTLPTQQLYIQPQISPMGNPILIYPGIQQQFQTPPPNQQQILQSQRQASPPPGQFQNFSVQLPLTPSPQPQQKQSFTQPRKYNPKLQDFQDDIYQVVNKKVLHDFESKPFTKIATTYKNLNDVQLSNAAQRGRSQNTGSLKSNGFDNLRTSYQKIAPPSFAILNHAASRVQKYLRGYIIRKRFVQFAKAYFFFKRCEKKFLIQDMVTEMKEAFINLKHIKTQMLKNYVNHCATNIQRVFRGFYARTVIVKIKRAFKKVEDKLKAVVIGWKIRRIMKTKEIDNYLLQIKDYQQATLDLVGDLSTSEKKLQLQRNLMSSRYNTIDKMIAIISKMQINGLWLMYRNLEKKERKNSSSSNATGISGNVNREVFTVNRKRKQGQKSSFIETSVNDVSGISQVQNQSHIQIPSQQNRSNSKNKLSVNGVRNSGNYLTIENDHPFAQQKLPRNLLNSLDNEAVSLRSTASFKNKQQMIENTANNNYYYCGYEQARMNESYQSKDEMNLYANNTIRQSQQQLVTVYNEVPLKSFSKETSFSTFNLTNSRFQPNFHSDAYKEQAKEIYKRRMHYNPRQAASKSRERLSNASSQNMFSPAKASPVKSYINSKANTINIANQRVQPSNQDNNNQRSRDEIKQDERQPSLNRSNEERKIPSKYDNSPGPSRQPNQSDQSQSKLQFSLLFFRKQHKKDES